MSTQAEDSNKDEIDGPDDFTIIDEVGEGVDADQQFEDEVLYDPFDPSEYLDNKKSEYSQPEVTEEQAEDAAKTDDVTEDASKTECHVSGIQQEECDNEFEEPEEEPEEENGVTNEEIEIAQEEDQPNVSVDNSENAMQVKEVSEISETVDSEDETDESKTQTHPYLYLIETFEFPKEILRVTEVKKPFEEKIFLMINTKASFQKMLQALRNEKEISIDLQIADQEFGQPICLISMSTREVNYIVDTLRLKNALLMLTEIFINPQILKVLFGADTTLKSLQQQLHLYMVNIFDIREARSLLFNDKNKNKISLSEIIRKDYSIERNINPKADFNARPLSEDVKRYCTSGVHYLLYFYHDYKNQFLSKSVDEYKQFLGWCRDACKVVYSGFENMELKALQDDLMNRHKCELEVLKKLFYRRNRIAKKANVEPEVVLHKNAFMTIVKELPSVDTYIGINSPFLKNEWYKIKKNIEESKAKFQVADLIKPNRMKKFPSKKAAPNQGNKQQKRKLSEHQDAAPQKQKRVEQSGRTNYPYLNAAKKKAAQNAGNRNKQKHGEFSSSKNTKFEYKNSSQKNTSSSIDNNYRPTPFVNQKSSTTNRFNSVTNTANRNYLSDSLTLNPTNVPSSVPFQSSTPFVNSGSVGHFGGGGRMEEMLQMSLGHVKEASASIRKHAVNEEDMLYRSLVDLKQARDSIRRQSGGFYKNRQQDLSGINQEINRLERQVKELQSRNSRGRNTDSSLFKGRY